MLKSVKWSEKKSYEENNNLWLTLNLINKVNI